MVTPIVPEIVVIAEPERISKFIPPSTFPVIFIAPPPPLEVLISISKPKETLPVSARVPLVPVFTFLFKVIVEPVTAMSFISVVAPSMSWKLTVPVPALTVKSVVVSPAVP